MPESVTCRRLYADENGESRFEDIELEVSPVQYAPPAPALGLTAPTEAKNFFWMRFPKDWRDAAHPSPRRQVIAVLSGVIEGWTNTGDTRTFRAGDVLLMEDSSGKGHGARTVGGEALGIVIALE